MYRKCFAALICILLSTNISFANELRNKSNELKNVTQKIHLLRKNLFSTKSKKENLLARLKRNELAIGFLSKKISQTQSKLLAQQKLLWKIEQQQEENQEKLEQQKIILTEQICR